MTDKSIYLLQAYVAKAMAHPIRIEVIDLLKEGELTFGALCETVGCQKSNLSQHLTSMVQQGILMQRKEGANMFYRLSSEKVAKACDLMRELLISNLEKSKALLKSV